MDSLAALKAEIAKKRKQANVGTTSAGARPAKRWRARADIEEEQRREYLVREKEDAERGRREKERKLKESQVESIDNYNASAQRAVGVVNDSTKDGSTGTSKERLKSAEVPRSEKSKGDPPLPKGEVMARLRGLKEPATLFGEDEWDRFNRLREIELAREEGSKGQRNVFQKKLREMEAKDAEEDMYNYARARLPEFDSKAGGSKQISAAQLEEEVGTPTCKEDYVYLQMRKYMRLWASEIESMSKEERRTNKGRSLAVTYEQTKDWLKPLYKLLRKRKLAKNILDSLKSIFEAAAEREYVRANSLYLERLAIGKAPWPMGATMVGIHARAAREKIGEDKIAHVMNDEQARKYIQAVKRLLTVAQRHFPTSFSKMIM